MSPSTKKPLHQPSQLNQSSDFVAIEQCTLKIQFLICSRVICTRSRFYVRRKVDIINSLSYIDGVWRGYLLCSIPSSNVHVLINIRPSVPSCVRMKTKFSQNQIFESSTQCMRRAAYCMVRLDPPVRLPGIVQCLVIVVNCSAHFCSSIALTGGGVSPGFKMRVCILGKASSGLLTNKKWSRNLFCSIAVFVLTIQYNSIPAGMPE